MNHYKECLVLRKLGYIYKIKFQLTLLPQDNMDSTENNILFLLDTYIADIAFCSRNFQKEDYFYFVSEAFSRPNINSK